MVIVDEAHHLRNRTTQPWRFVAELSKRFILVPTATPVQNNLEELFHLVILPEPGLLSTARRFTQWFIDRQATRCLDLPVGARLALGPAQALGFSVQVFWFSATFQTDQKEQDTFVAAIDAVHGRQVRHLEQLLDRSRLFEQSAVVFPEAPCLAVEDCHALARSRVVRSLAAAANLRRRDAESRFARQEAADGRVPPRPGRRSRATDGPGPASIRRHRPGHGPPPGDRSRGEAAPGGARQEAAVARPAQAHEPARDPPAQAPARGDRPARRAAGRAQGPAPPGRSRSAAGPDGAAGLGPAARGAGSAGLPGLPAADLRRAAAAIEQLAALPRMRRSRPVPLSNACKWGDLAAKPP